MRALLCVSFVFLFVGCQRDYVMKLELTREEIGELSKAEVPAPEIISKINRSGTVYFLDSQAFIDLHQEGVDAEVIEHMRETPARRYYPRPELPKLTTPYPYYRCYYPSHGPGYYSYPSYYCW